MLVDFMMGLPKRSQRMMATKTENPRPINSGAPQLRGRGIDVQGTLPFLQRPFPPAQFSKPCRKIRIIFMPSNRSIGPYRFDELDTNQHDSWAGNNWREELLNEFRWHERHADFKQCTNTPGSEKCSVSLRARETNAFGGDWAVAILIHLVESSLGDGDGCERGSDAAKGKFESLLRMNQLTQK